MANKHRGQYTVTLLDGEAEKEFTLVFDFNALCLFEERAGIAAAELPAQLDHGKLSVLRTALWAGLMARNSKITPPRVGAMFIQERTDEYIVAVMKGFSVAMGADPEKVDEAFAKALTGETEKKPEEASPGKDPSA